MSAETQKVDVQHAIAQADLALGTAGLLEDDIVRRELRTAGDAVAELIEAASLRVEWINGTWYVLTAGGAALTNIWHPSEESARREAAEALEVALARVGGAA